MALRFLVWAALVTQTFSAGRRRWAIERRLQDAAPAAGAGPAESVKRTTFAAAAFSTTMKCRVSLQNMLYNEDWIFMNDTASRWCRIRLENKMATCCANAEFAKGKAACGKAGECVADCSHSKMADLCNSNFGKACLLTRQPFARFNVTMAVSETFCVPSECNNAEDLANNLLVKWYDAQYRQERTSTSELADDTIHWLENYGDSTPIECPTQTFIIILSVIIAIIVISISIPLGIFLFKAPKERGRVLRGIEEEDDEHDEDTPVEALQDQNASGTMGSSGFGR